MGYQETTGATSRKINLNIKSDKTGNQGRSQTGLGWVQELTGLYKPIRGGAEEGGAERNKEGDKQTRV